MAGFLKSPCDEGVIRSAPDAGSCPRQVGPWILAATILGSSLVFIDGTVVNVALPALQADLHANVAGVQWVFEAYALFLAALILVGGSLGDRFGRRRILAIGTLLFAAASAAAGLSLRVEEVIAARAIQGIGGALLTPGSLAIISAGFSPKERGRAIGTWAGFTAMTSAVGPMLGGWLVDHYSWRWVFFINLPLALIVLWITFWRVPESRDMGVAKLDWPGALTATVGLGALVYGLIQSATLGLTHPIVLGTVSAGLVVLVACLLVEANSQAPMMPLSLFRSRTFSGANLLTLLLYSALSGALFFVPFNLIQVQGYSATAAGASFLPFIVIMFLLSRWSGGLATRYGPRLPLVVGPTVAAIGFALFALPGIGGSYWTTFFPASVILGLGFAITVAPLSTAVMAAVEMRHAGLASGVNNAVSRIAGLLAIAVMSIVLLHIFAASMDGRLAPLRLPPEVRQALDQQKSRLAYATVPTGLNDGMATQVRRAIDESFVAGFRGVSLVAAGLALASALAAGLMIENRSEAIPSRDRGQAPRPVASRGRAPETSASLHPAGALRDGGLSDSEGRGGTRSGEG